MKTFTLTFSINFKCIKILIILKIQILVMYNNIYIIRNAGYTVIKTSE